MALVRRSREIQGDFRVLSVGAKATLNNKRAGALLRVLPPTIRCSILFSNLFHIFAFLYRLAPGDRAIVFSSVLVIGADDGCTAQVVDVACDYTCSLKLLQLSLSTSSGWDFVGSTLPIYQLNLYHNIYCRTHQRININKYALCIASGFCVKPSPNFPCTWLRNPCEHMHNHHWPLHLSPPRYTLRAGTMQDWSSLRHLGDTGCW